MRISVAICTWNRSQLLDRTLEEMRRLECPPDVTWELLVVNNNCTDDTDAVIAKHASALPLRRLSEPKPGLSHARNCAVAAATGDYVLWTDDDVLVDPHWLAEYARSATRHPEGVFFGGPIAPWFATTPPPWLESVFALVASAYAARDLGRSEQSLSIETLPYGANYMVRSLEQKALAYDHRLGRKGASMVSGEETALLRTLLSQGCPGWWVPGATVRHYIPAERISKSYLWKYYDGVGRQKALDSVGEDRSPRVFGKPRWLWRQAIQASLQYYWDVVLMRPPALRIGSLIRAAEYRGWFADSQ